MIQPSMKRSSFSKLYVAKKKEKSTYLLFTYHELIVQTQIFHKESKPVKCIPPYTPLLYRKIGVGRDRPIFLFLIQNIDCGYSLEPPRKGGSNVYTQSMF